MSTAALDIPVVALPAPARRPGPVRGVHPARGVRPAHLRLVPTGADADAVGHHAHAPRRSRRSSALRITRLGRLALTGTAAVVLALVLLSVMGGTGPAGATSSVVVQPGMTLSQIASEQLPGVPLSMAVTDIQRANKLSTTSIAVGQELVIPGR